MMRLSLPLLALLVAPLAFAQSAKDLNTGLAPTAKAPASPGEPTAKELNTEGFRLYQAGKYPEALEKFRAAVARDPKHALAHYNVAATLGVLRKQGKVCDHDAYTSTILQHLATAIKLDPKRLKRAKEDPDLDPIRETVGWHRLLGRSHTRTADMPELLKKVKWFGPGVGVYGTLQTLRFEEGGKVVLTKKVPQDEGPMKEETLTGTYSVKSRKVEVTLPGQKPDTGAITAEGVLQFKSLGSFYDFPSECDA
jgi:tetratricopeptide (TPR) repeat protein